MRTLILSALVLLAAAPPASAADAPSASGAGPMVDPEIAGSQSNAFLLKSIGPPRGTPLAGAELERRTQEVASVVRCPVCQGSSVADSPSTMARNMKQEVHDLLAQGYSKEQILEYFELAYGEFIRMEPRADGFNALLWLMPVLVLVGGLGAVLLVMRRARRAEPVAESASAATPTDTRGALPEDVELAGYVREVRRLAYGWPDGVPPQPPTGGGRS